LYEVGLCSTKLLTDSAGGRTSIKDAIENRALRRISGPKRDEVTGDNLYSSPSIIRMIKSGG
jgi:hypothetical protein